MFKVGSIANDMLRLFLFVLVILLSIQTIHYHHHLRVCQGKREALK